jgi:GNAT superfamily N-acetyltransferase
MSSISFSKADILDALTLTDISKQTFDTENIQYIGKPGGPPGYDSVAWQRKKIEETPYLKIMMGDEIIGGVILYPKELGHMMLGRIFIHPDHHDKGFGTATMNYLEENFPARKWSLETPTYAERNHHFYEKLGYERKGRVPDCPEPLFIYEKYLD